MEKSRERTQKRLKREKIVKIMVRLHCERVKVQAYFEIKFRSQSKGKLWFQGKQISMGLV